MHNVVQLGEGLELPTIFWSYKDEPFLNTHLFLQANCSPHFGLTKSLKLVLPCKPDCSCTTRMSLVLKLCGASCICKNVSYMWIPSTHFRILEEPILALYYMLKHMSGSKIIMAGDLNLAGINWNTLNTANIRI
ncbi:hypothetical protein V5799_006032 [Amblyomma americanum]|uniref:Endonuclease/exonuclease/phosphatase domain-containing protein n=1 Tax=Amblyomma americanum TaxID=6943 RepID=A0AAQ4DXJ7_AMBAM